MLQFWIFIATFGFNMKFIIKRVQTSYIGLVVLEIVSWYFDEKFQSFDCVTNQKGIQKHWCFAHGVCTLKILKALIFWTTWPVSTHFATFSSIFFTLNSNLENLMFHSIHSVWVNWAKRIVLAREYTGASRLHPMAFLINMIYGNLLLIPICNWHAFFFITHHFFFCFKVCWSVLSNFKLKSSTKTTTNTTVWCFIFHVQV